VKVSVDKQHDGVKVSLTDQGKELFTGTGKTTQEAAHWVLRHLKRVTDQTAQLLCDSGILMKEEMESILDRDLEDVLEER
jgi:predicted fused transcriptional regulator/phosphomethylpyrimidine kinase